MLKNLCSVKTAIAQPVFSPTCYRNTVPVLFPTTGGRDMIPAWLTDAWNWIVNNPLFSGVGGTALVAFLGWLLRRNKNAGKSASANNNSSATQAGRDVNSGDRNDFRNQCQYIRNDGNSQMLQAVGDISITNNNGMSNSDVTTLVREEINNAIIKQPSRLEAYTYIKFSTQYPIKIFYCKNIASLADTGILSYGFNFYTKFDNNEYTVRASGDCSVNFTVTEKSRAAVVITFSDPCPNIVLLEFYP